MDKPISIGDLVIILRAHCPGSEAIELGMVRIVEDLMAPPASQSLQCRQCHGIYWWGGPIAQVEPNGWHPTPWLKRIPPLGELESEKRDEEITA